LARANVATSWILSSVLTVLGWLVCSLSSKLSLSRKRRLCHLNTALQPKASLLYAYSIIWNVSVADLPNIWQNLTFERCSNCDIFYFCHSQTHSDFLNTLHTYNCFLLGSEENGHGTISWCHVSAVAHNGTTMRPIHENIDCTMQIFQLCSFTLPCT
jgi:hypothetical protein